MRLHTVLFFCACLAGVSEGFPNLFDAMNKWKASMDAITGLLSFNNMMQQASMNLPKPPADGAEEAQGEVDEGAADADEAKAEVEEGTEAPTVEQEEAVDGDAAANETKEEVPKSEKWYESAHLGRIWRIQQMKHNLIFFTKIRTGRPSWS